MPRDGGDLRVERAKTAQRDLQHHDRVTAWKRSISHEHKHEGEEAMRNGLASIVKKRYLSYTVIGNFFCLLATAFASEPTLQESIEFIKTKVHGSCKYKYNRKIRTAFVTKTKETSGYTVTLQDNKTILVKETVEQTELATPEEGYVIKAGDDPFESIEERWRSTWNVKVRLADLSTDVKVNIPDEVERDGTARDIVVGCTKPDCLEWRQTNRKKTTIKRPAFKSGIQRDESRLPDRQKSGSSYILFTVCGQEKAEKIKKALTHAIRISGGKDELF